nr:hypothetical protein CFP56_69143 [Quercus suber]
MNEVQVKRRAIYIDHLSFSQSCEHRRLSCLSTFGIAFRPDSDGSQTTPMTESYYTQQGLDCGNLVRNLYRLDHDRSFSHSLQSVDRID